MHLICFDTALLEQPPLPVMALCDFNDRLLDHCQVSSVPHYCGFNEQEIPTIYTLWMVINPFNPTGHNSDRKKVFIYKALKTLLTDVSVHFLQIWKT